VLDSNPKAIKKIARERYFMKADDEDIFVLSDDEKTGKSILNDETVE
jgi:cell division protein FtsB